jgi:hypothetical protein
MATANILLCPAYYFEAKGFNSLHQPKNQLVKEVVARIVAIAAPILYLYQICLHGVVSLIDLVLCIPGITPGILLQSSIPSFFYSCKNFASSICEIPQKILFGSHCQANYFGDSCRYKRIDYLSTIGTNLI